jgi:3-deoxy-D-manno-octulosonic-acid transferase
MNSIAFALYQLAAAFAVSAGAVYLALFRFHELRERLGGGGRGARGDVIWIHAASLGEFEAAWPVVRACGWSETPARLLFSCTNAAARRRLQERLPAGARARIAPLDFWPCVARALARERPVALVFIETEIWPAWIVAASRRGIPIVILSARLSDSSFPRYRRLRGFLRSVLSRISAIGCRTEEDRKRWIAIGAAEDRCFVWGNTKYDAGSLGLQQTRRAGDLFLLVAGSVRPGEEEILDLVNRQAMTPIRLVLVPRHLPTVPHWEEACARRGLGCRRSSLSGFDFRRGAAGAGQALRRSDPTLPPILIVDEIGLLNELYGIADAAFVGGTWAPIGGHNLFEPARQGIPVFFGHSLSGVRDAAGALVASGGGIEVADAGVLATAIDRVAMNEEERARIGRQARQAAESLAGGVERTVAGLRAVGFLADATR